MAKKEQLRNLRAGTIINATAKEQEKEIIQALRLVEQKLKARFSVQLGFEKNWYLKDIVKHLKNAFPDVDFKYHFESSSIRPDGGVLFLINNEKKRFPILIGEVKNQGTNDRRKEEGLKKQAKGNAIERLGKNVIGLRTALLQETIFPFICFGYGCDFADDSSILDRVATIAMFGNLNKIHLHRQGPNGDFNRGSFFFREEKWTIQEMSKTMYEIASRSIQYYFSKYNEDTFIH